MRFGHSRQGAQRYHCNDCGKTFTATTKSIFAHAKNPDLLPIYLGCMKHRLSLRESAKECGISLRTSFQLQHRILDTLTASQPTAAQDGIVEADETYLDLSFKGNHTADGFEMPASRIAAAILPFNAVVLSTRSASSLPSTARMTATPSFPTSAIPVVPTSATPSVRTFNRHPCFAPTSPAHTSSWLRTSTLIWCD